MSAIDFARSASTPAASTVSTPTSSAASARIDGVPTVKRSIDAAGAYPGSKANGARWPSQPDSGCANGSPASAARWRSATYTNAGAPGPPFRYL